MYQNCSMWGPHSKEGQPMGVIHMIKRSDKRIAHNRQSKENVQHPMPSYGPLENITCMLCGARIRQARCGEFMEQRCERSLTGGYAALVDTRYQESCKVDWVVRKKTD